MILLIKKNDNNVDPHSIRKELHYNTTHTDYMYQRKVINNHKTCNPAALFHISTKR